MCVGRGGGGGGGGGGGRSGEEGKWVDKERNIVYSKMKFWCNMQRHRGSPSTTKNVLQYHMHNDISSPQQFYIYDCHF